MVMVSFYVLQGRGPWGGQPFHDVHLNAAYVLVELAMLVVVADQSRSGHLDSIE